jgi:RND family efflux transporter MFP subunit
VISKKAQLDARIDQARAEIANSKIQASYSRIVAPVSGVIVKKFVEAGATAAPGVPLLAIEDNSQYLLEVTVPESHSKMVRLSDRLNVQIDALGADRITGIVRDILPTLDAASRSLTVKIELPAYSLLRTGLYGRARFLLAQRDEMSLPRAAIIQRGQLSGIYIVGPDGTVRFRIVTTGKTTDDMVEVLSGVDVGDEVAGSGLDRLFDGAKVR